MCWMSGLIHSMKFKIISWNVAGRKRKQNNQFEFLKEEAPDIAALQEVTASTRDLWREALSAIGYCYILDTAPDELSGPRRYGQMLASKTRLSASEIDLLLPWQERVTAASIDVCGVKVNFVTTHIPPGSSNGWVKIEIFEKLYSDLARAQPVRFVLCGDFNSPKVELPNGAQVTWGHKVSESGAVTTKARIRGGSGLRWAQAELSVVGGMRALDARDVFRDLNGYHARDASFCLKRNGKEFPRRFDHIFASNGIQFSRCYYRHEARTLGLSDHSMIVGEISEVR